MVKNPPASVGGITDAVSIPGLGRSPDGGHDNPLQGSCLGKLMDSGGWPATVHRIAELDVTEVTWHACTYW